jgi:hypothetical protein
MRMRNQAAQERARLDSELAALHVRVDAAYTDKLDGKIPESFGQRKQAEWQQEEFRIKSLISGFGENKSSEWPLNLQRF